MADASWPRGSHPDDGWGPATSVRASGDAAAPHRTFASGRTAAPGAGRAGLSEPDDGRSAPFRPAPPPGPPGSASWDRLRAAGPTLRERGLAGWSALLLLIVVTLLGILLDAARGQQLGTGFNIGIIAGSVLGILAVRRSSMFPVVVAPPIVYSLGAGISLYLRSGGLHDRGVLIDAATNWLVYGFPAIAAATALVLIIAGIRLVVRR